MYELTVKSEFEAAHHIEGYQGKCQRLHGHNWTVEAVIVGNELDELGMLVDFKLFKNELNDVLKEFDHIYLNELKVFENKNPTAENIAKIIFDELSKSKLLLKSKANVKAIKVFETPKSCVTYINNQVEKNFYV